MLVVALFSPAAAQTGPAVENAPAIHLGDSETLVRARLNAHTALYPTPFASGRFTLKAGDGLFIDFQNGKVVEVDATSKSSPIRIGGVAVGSDLGSARTALAQGNDSQVMTFSVLAADGEIFEIRGGSDQRVHVIALIGDRTHPPANAKTGRIVLQNSGHPR